MGIGIAQNFAQAGLTVKSVARRQETLDNAMIQMEANLKLFDEYGLLQEPVATIMSRISTVQAKYMSQAMESCDYVVETIPEVMETKKETLAQVEECNQDIIIASNTGSFTITELSDGMKNPSRVVGVHYFNPPHIIPAVELHRGKNTTDEAVEITRELMLRVGKKPVLVRKEVPGFIVNRLTGSSMIH